jgi:type I restriction enzyme S subunit
MLEGWRQGTYADVLRLDVDPVEVRPEGVYPILGVLNFGRGILRRPPVTSAETSYKSLNRIQPGQLVYSKLKAFEGAITVTPQDLPESYASGEFPTFSCNDQMDAAYLRLLTQEPALWTGLALRSKGIGGRRERLNPRDFLTMPVLIPPLHEQRRIVDLIEAVDDAAAAAQACELRIGEALEIIRDVKLWRLNGRMELSHLCRVDGSLVDPTGPNGSLPHVGAERIVSGSGDLVGVTSASDDGVTSGKYPFSASHVIYSKIRPNLRKVALPNFSGLCSADAYPLLPTADVPRRYLQQLLLSRPFTEQAVARSGRTKMPKINQVELMSIEVPATSSEEMRFLADEFEAIDQTRHAVHQELASVRQLRSNLLTALLSGEHVIPQFYDELMEA